MSGPINMSNIPMPTLEQGNAYGMNHAVSPMNPLPDMNNIPMPTLEQGNAYGASHGMVNNPSLCGGPLPINQIGGSINTVINEPIMPTVSEPLFPEINPLPPTTPMFNDHFEALRSVSPRVKEAFDFNRGYDCMMNNVFDDRFDNPLFDPNPSVRSGALLARDIMDLDYLHRTSPVPLEFPRVNGISTVRTPIDIGLPSSRHPEPIKPLYTGTILDKYR